MFGNPVRNLRVINLEQQAVLTVVRVALFRDLVTWTTDLNKLLHADFGSLRSWLYGCFFRLLRSPACKILLMLLTLGVRQVAALVCVQG